MTTALRHPGPVAADRIVSVATRSREVDVELEPGARLLDAISDAASAAGVDSAQVELLSGTLDPVSYCLPAACPDGRTAATFSETHTARGPVSIVGGGVTFGRRDGAPFMHCHLAWLDATGALRGGHLWPETTVGPVPVRAVLHPLPGVQSLSAEDAETRLPVFTPVRAGNPPTAGRRVVFSRVRPGEDIQVAAHRICADHGFERGIVRGSVGSLVGPALHHGGRAPAPPCTEVAAILGEVGPRSPGAPLYVVAVDSAGEVFAGLLDAPNSPVAITVELLVLEA